MTPTSTGAESRHSAEVGRRVVLEAAAGTVVAVLVAACGRSVDQRDRPGAAGAGRSTGPLDLDLRLVTRAISEEESLGAYCTAAARRFAGQRSSLSAVASRQRDHALRLRATLSDLDPPVDHTPVRLPRTSAALTTTLGELLLHARTGRSADCVAATSGLLAELFSSIAAGHAVTLLSVDPQALDSSPVSVPRKASSVLALQPCLAAEHAAMFGYGVLGGVISAAVSDTASAKAAIAAYDVHRTRRDDLTQLIDAAGGRPVAAKATYGLPFPVAGIPTARRLARHLEAGCASVYARATAATTGDTRRMMSDAVTDCAVRGGRWGSPPAAFPGLEA